MPSPAPAASARRRPYRVAELAALWDLDQSTVYRMIYAGRLRAERHGLRGGAIRVPVDAVAEYLTTIAAAAAAS
jgi:excisionase family DNA binding protein